MSFPQTPWDIQTARERVCGFNELPAQKRAWRAYKRYKIFKSVEYEEFLIQKNILQERRKKFNEKISQLTPSQLELISKEKLDETSPQTPPSLPKLLSGYFEALDKLEKCWKKRENSEPSLQGAITLGEGLVDVFPIVKEYMALDEIESSISAAKDWLNSLDFDSFTKKVVVGRMC
jgi:hypothetical protein